MTVQVVGVVDVKDKDTFGKYLEVAAKAVEKHGGRVAQRGAPGDGVLEDTGAASSAVFVLLEFPSAENAHGWINDPELKPVHELRRGGANTTIRIITPL